MDETLDTAPCGFVSFRDDGELLDINQRLTRILGYERGELPGSHIEKILPPGGRIFYHTYLLPLLKVQGFVEEIYLALRTKDGQDVPVLLNGVRRERDEGAVNNCVTMRLIQRHEYEDQLLHARRLAEESNAAKAKFLSMMSHDLRSPLTTIYGNADLLAKSALGDLNAEQAEAVEAIREAARMQMTLVTDLLDFARMQSGNVEVKPEVVAVNDAIARARALVRVQVNEAGLSLQVQECDAGTSVLADSGKLQQILLNLLTNAVKFTPPGGSILVGCSAGDGRVRITVRDTGVGIPEADLPRIFSPFVQLGNAGSPAATASSTLGVGLGLAICRDLARAMQGDVTAESTPGNGSTFIIDLPAESSPEERKSPEPETSKELE